MTNTCLGLLAVILITSVAAVNMHDDPARSLADLRKKAEKIMRDGNYKEALEIYQKLALDTNNAPHVIGSDLMNALGCCQAINREKETDDFRQKVINTHSNNWRLLHTAAQSFMNDNHYGTIIAGQFERGPHRGGGRYVNTFERDRVAALQLYAQALDKATGEKDIYSVASMCQEFAEALMGYRGYNESWRLQYLTDLKELPDYEDGYRYFHGGQSTGAPVDEDGKPVLHRLPKTFETAQSDGERWRWLLNHSVQLDKSRATAVQWTLAQFFHQQFGVQTMAYYGWFRGSQDDDSGKDESGPFAVHTLKDEETIARLATGIKRFTLPHEFNPLKIYQALADARASYADGSLDQLAQIMEDRRQYDRAAEYWQRSIKAYGPGHDNWKQKRLDQILGNWGQFEPVMTHPSSKEATVEFRFRNGRRVSFDASEINVSLLLSDVKEYLKSNPKELDWEKAQIDNLGYRLVEKNQARYLGKTVERWDLDLQPRDKHFDKLITIRTPLKKAGAYLVTARMDGGNTCKIVIWINDTILVQKQLDKSMLYFVADAATGKPLSKTNVEFFGYYQKWLGDGLTRFSRHYDVITSQFAENSDDNGLVQLRRKDVGNYQWLVTASTPEGRLAYLGFNSIWFGNYYDHEYNQTKVFIITDRPVYRPNQSVKFKVWVRHAKYDQADTSSFAKQSFAIRIDNPKSEKAMEKSFTADEFGGFDGEMALPSDATLGMYQMSIFHGGPIGNSSFRVEEYKKPEFEVTVEAPSEPVMLGEKIAAKINAKYYFGAPVKNGKVKYKVLRSSYSANWYPWAPWDWFYGRGYWWFAYDYKWYPSWSEWGCFCPHPWWWPAATTPPEIVAEATVPVGEDGSVKVELDTAIAAAVHGNTDHRYEITAEVTDESRRTIVGQGQVLVARKPFKVYAWVDRGHYRPGDTVLASFNALTLDSKPVKGKGELKLLKITYGRKEPGLLDRVLGRKADSAAKLVQDPLAPIEEEVQSWKLDTNDDGRSEMQIKASKAGQYRLAYKVTDSKNHTIEGGYVFVIRGEQFDEKNFRFNDIELVPEKKEYEPGDKLQLAVNTEQENATVLLFVRPANGVCLEPKVLYLKGKSALEQIEITKKDMPNFFVEALTVNDGRVHTQAKEIVVPPESRVLGLEVLPSAKEYKPGEKATVKIKLTDLDGKPFVGSTVMTVYDKSVEYISGGSNIPEIKAFFWKWRRNHSPQTVSNADKHFFNLTIPKHSAMAMLGVFGDSVVDQDADGDGMPGMAAKPQRQGGKGRGSVARMSLAAGAHPAEPGVAMADAVGFSAALEDKADRLEAGGAGEAEAMPGTEIQPAVRKDFADTAYWIASLLTDDKGTAEVSFKMPENLTGWKIKTWAMGHGTKVAEASADVVTTKNLLLRLQAPRFFVEKDEVVLSANIHNYLKNSKAVKAVLELEGGCLESIDKPTQSLDIKAGGEQRVDWKVKVVKEGEAVVRMKALTDEESDAMQMKFPVYVHGMLKTDSYCGVIRPEKDTASVAINVPAERRIEQSVLEIRYSPTLAGAMVDALPYLVEYPYGCTEQTLNRFLPTVMTQRILKDMGLSLKAIKEKRTNLNAQEIGDDRKRAEQWKRWDRNPVFDEDTVDEMVKKGLRALTEMQLSDGGWGWFSGWGEHSYPHTTAYVVHGLQIAKQNGVAIVPGVLDRGISWLEGYQKEQIRLIRNAKKEIHPWKQHADDLDAFVYMVLVDAKRDSEEMRDYLYRDRNALAIYSKAMFGMGLHKTGQKDKLEMIMRNIEQFLVEDKENQSAYLNLGNGSCWWYWYGSEYEAHAYYLKLLALTDPKSEKAAGLVKYLLNNRKHATYWNSTRDTAICVEAMADYLRASNEGKPDMVVEIFVDGQKKKEVAINADNIFSFDNKLLISGKSVESGKHTVEIRRKGTGPVYFNAYLTNFTLEDHITKAGLEIKVNRKYYKLNPVAKTIKAAGSRGQVLDQKVEKYERKELANLAELKSGDLVEIEMEVESKNDYEYIILEDMKPAGFEPVEVRSGYNGNDMGAYVEFRDERVCMFVRALARGNHSVSYRMRAEIPGKFSALPTKASAMYAPELRANSDEIKLKISD